LPLPSSTASLPLAVGRRPHREADLDLIDASARLLAGDNLRAGPLSGS
jgi:hypothetical protein